MAVAAFARKFNMAHSHLSFQFGSQIKNGAFSVREGGHEYSSATSLLMGFEDWTTYIECVQKQYL